VVVQKLNNNTEPQAAANEFRPSTDDDIVRVFYLTHADSPQAEFRPSSGDDIVRVFYLTQTDTPQAFQEVVTQVRSTTQVRKAFTINSQRAVAMRGTAAQVALADQLFRERDK
jgi:hypothetical protein